MARPRHLYQLLKRINMTALNKQVSGTHYKDLKIQPIEYIHANGLDFLQGNVVKYVTRHKSKNGKADIEKAIHYLEMILQLQYGEDSKDFQESMDYDGWIVWRGGECPVEAETFIDWKLRDNSIYLNKRAGYLSWSHEMASRNQDITAYRVVK